MKKLFRNIALFAATAVAAVGCAPEQGEIIDTIELNRALTPLEFKASVIASKGTDVEFSWEAMEGTEKYTLQLFAAAEDAEGNTVAPNYDEASPIETYIVLPEEIPFVVENLPVDESFYARVRGHKTNVEDSHWAVLEKDFSTYPVRSNLYPKAIERGTDYIVIEWNAAEDKADLTTVRVAPVMGGEEKVVELTSADKNACNKKIEGLVACTDYRIELIYGKAGSRGVTTAWTRPSTEGTNLVESVDAIVNAITGTIGDVKLRLAYNDGVPYDLPSVAAIQCNLYLYGETTGDGKKPIISGLDIQPAGSVTAIHIEDLVLDGAVNAVPGSEAKGHIVTFTANNSIGALEIINSEIYGYTKGLAYNNVAGANCDVFKLEGVYVHDVNADGKVGGDFIDFRNGVLPSISVKNSTFSMCARTFFRISDNADCGDVLVENCTFNMVTATATSSNNAGIFGIRTKTTPSSIVCKNNVFLNEISDGEDQSDASKCFVRLVRNSSDTNAPVCSGNYFFNVGAGWFVSAATDIAGGAFSEAAALAEGGQILTEDPCVNSLANKLYLNTTSDISAKKVGDPRWWNAQQPIVIRATELTLESEPRVWDFTVKSKFDTESLVKPTIIDNVRIYGTAEVPAEVVMGEGVKFSKGAMVNAEGEPEYSAVGVLTEGYGAIVVTAQGESGIETMQVLAGGDRYTILADGEPHKVGLGDLAGENNIYVLASSAVTLTKVEWTKDLTPDQTVFPLAKPAITLSATSLDEGTAEAVTVSWAAVENAASYVLTGLGQSLTFTADQPLELAVPAEQVAVLPVGEYEITLTAYPVETSNKYSASETATATFKIKKVVLGGEVTLTWDFASAAWADALTAIGTSDNTAVDLTVDGLRVYAGGEKMKAGTNYIQMGGKSAGQTRLFIFTAPASGTLKVWSSNTGSSEDLNRLVTAANGADDVADTTTAQTNPGGTPSNVDPTVSTFDIDITKGNQVFIYPQVNGLRFYKIEYTYVQAAPKAHYVWDFATPDWVAKLVEIGTSGKSDVDITVEGLSVLSGGGSIKASDTTAGQYYIQPGGKGDANKRYFKFIAPGSGTLKVWSSNTGGSADDTRKVAVQQGEDASTLVEKSGGSPSGETPTENEFTVEEGEVRIWASGNALRFYKFEYQQD